MATYSPPFPMNNHKPALAPHTYNFISPETARNTTDFSAQAQPIGPIGSSHPGMGTSNKLHDLRIPLMPPSNSTGESNVPQRPSSQEAVSPELCKELISPHLRGSNAIDVSSAQDGYSLRSSMWATPTPAIPQNQLPPPSQTTRNQRLSAGVLIPLHSESDNNQDARRQSNYLALHFEPPVEPTAHLARVGLASSPDFAFGKLEGSSAFNSPALSFTQTSSAPSTARSFLASDTTLPQLRNPFSTFQLSLKDQELNPALAPKSPAALNPGLRNGSCDITSNEACWPPLLSFGEEAFYSKSNVTKTQNTSSAAVAPFSHTRPPNLWQAPESHTSALSSPPEINPPAPLASPFLAQPYTSELISQLSLRIEHLERKSAKQEQEISQLKANVNLIGVQSQKTHQTIAIATASPINTSILQNPVRNRNSQSAPSPLGTNPASTPYSASSPSTSLPSNGTSQPPVLTPDLAIHTQQALSSAEGANLAPRQFGPLDYSGARANPMAITSKINVIQPPPSASSNHTGFTGTSTIGGVNYRALLAGDMECDYEHFIRRITEHNDQQASIFMQQKLKQSAMSNTNVGGDKNLSGTNGLSAREEITKLVIQYSLELMANRFGNFLVSRAIEHATARERLILAEQIRGQIVMLSQDTFATHCLQKMIDVDEEAENPVRWLISQELLKKKETVTHKSAGHVWARLLSIGGGSSGTMSLGPCGKKIHGPNQYGDVAGKAGGLERSLNDLLRGEWARTAKDEVGSLIVQSVLENWHESAKSDVIEELLTDIYSCSVQQWGNFVILHLIEHSNGDIQKRLFSRLTETQLACELSIDNFGAKAIEKVLKVSGMDSRIVEDYVKAICEYGHGRPALIDIACHQAGAQVLTLLFTSAPNPIRELMIQTVRRNGVTMKSSKAGSKIVSGAQKTFTRLGGSLIAFSSLSGFW